MEIMTPSIHELINHV